MKLYLLCAVCCVLMVCRVDSNPRRQLTGIFEGSLAGNKTLILLLLI